jgi:hypothetical protein
MITKETCVKIWNAHNEIEKANQLIADLAKIVGDDKVKGAPHLRDAFGDRRGLQLGVPCGESSHRLYNVNLDLSVKVIQLHIKEQQDHLIELMAIAKIELSS